MGAEGAGDFAKGDMHIEAEVLALGNHGFDFGEFGAS